jgi:hypothetical protein
LEQWIPKPPLIVEKRKLKTLSWLIIVSSSTKNHTCHGKGKFFKAWTKKKIEGFHFGGFDTVFSSEIKHLSENDCWRMQQTKLCGENKMIEN